MLSNFYISLPFNTNEWNTDSMLICKYKAEGDSLQEINNYEKAIGFYSVACKLLPKYKKYNQLINLLRETGYLLANISVYDSSEKYLK